MSSKTKIFSRPRPKKPPNKPSPKNPGGRNGAGANPPPQVPAFPGCARLARIELEIVCWVAHGYTMKAIAAERGRSYRTVEKQLQNIRRKLFPERPRERCMPVMLVRHVYGLDRPRPVSTWRAPHAGVIA